MPMRSARVEEPRRVEEREREVSRRSNHKRTKSSGRSVDDAVVAHSSLRELRLAPPEGLIFPSLESDTSGSCPSTPSSAPHDPWTTVYALAELARNAQSTEKQTQDTGDRRRTF